MEMAPHAEKNEGLNLSQKWLRHLRESVKTTVALPCRYCRDRKILSSEELLWAHMLDTHPEKVPKDREAQEEFQKLLKSQFVGSIRSRPRDDSAANPHEELASVESEPQKPSRDDLRSSLSPPSIPTPLTASGLQILGTKLKWEESSNIKHSDTLASRSIKKRAIGHGHSPYSSVKTTFSNDSLRRIPVKNVSPKRKLSLQRQVTALLKTQELDESEIFRPPATGKRLFDPDADPPFTAQGLATNAASQRPRSSPQQPQHRRGQSSGKLHSQWPMSSGEPGLFSASVLGSTPANKQETPPPDSPKIVRQPETRPISQEQLVAEVKGIYAGLVIVEDKCIQVDTKQPALAREAPAGTQPKLNNEQWQALIALHRTLLHEHHDFFLASQHPSATLAVRRLAIKYAIPARLWHHSIHSFLELLRNRLPDSLDHMLAFIYLAYSMMTLLFETVPAFEETWIECLGDLGRYRMAIEDDDIRDREVWTQVSRQWYLNVSDRAPRVGRLYHHLAILACPNALQQLFFYGKALSVSQPFTAAKESILTLFEPILSSKQMHGLPPVITTYFESHAYLFMQNELKSYDRSLAEFISHLDGHISQVTQRFLEQEYYIGISNCFALLSYGSPDELLLKALSIPTLEHMASTNMTTKDCTQSCAKMMLFNEALQLFVQTLEINRKCLGGPNVLSFLYVTVPILEKNDLRPTPEEFAMRGLEWAASYFPADWFENQNIEEENQSKEENRYREDASMNTDYRPERSLWLGNDPPDAVLVKAHSVADGSETTDVGTSGISIEIGNTDAVVFEGAPQLFVPTVEIHLKRVGDPNILSFLHATMLWAVFVSNAMELLEGGLWKELVTMFDTLLSFYHDYFPIDGNPLLVSDKNNFLRTPLHETVPTFEESWIQRLGRLGKYVFGSFKSIVRYAKSLTRILRTHKPILLLPACMIFIKGVAAVTTGSLPSTYDDDTSDSFSLFFEIMATHFINDIAGPLLFNVCVSLILTAVHIIIVLLHNGRWRGRSLLLLVTIAMCLGFFYLTMGEHLSGWQMVIGWVFAASFLLTYIQEKLANLQHSGIHALTIVAPGMAGAALVATYAEIDGKWSDRWILAAVAVLPCIMASTSIWVAFFHQTTIIHGIDNGTYIAQALDVLRDIWADVRIWHGLSPPNAPRASPDLEAQALRVTDKTITSLGNNTTEELRPIPTALDDDGKPVEPNVPKPANMSKRERRQKYYPQRPRAGTRLHGQSSAVPESAVSNKNKKLS